MEWSDVEWRRKKLKVFFVKDEKIGLQRALSQRERCVEKQTERKKERGRWR